MGNGSPLINLYFCSRHIKGNVVSRFATRPSLIRLMASVDVKHHERRRWEMSVSYSIRLNCFDVRSRATTCTYICDVWSTG